MSATFTITVNKVYTATEGNLANVVKKADWTMTGTQDEQNFALPQTTDLAAADPGNFVAFDSLSQENVIAWIESAAAQNIEAIKAHIQFVLDKECAKAALAGPAMPWAPPPAPAPEGTTPVAP